MLKIELESGEIVVGTPNYVTVKIAEIRLTDGSFRDLKRDEIKAITRPKQGA